MSNYLKKTLHLIRKLKRAENTELIQPSRKEMTGVTINDEVPFSSGLLTGKKVLITGAGENIGRSIALEMARQGAQIFFTDIEKARCRKFEREMTEKNFITRGFKTDCSNIGELEKLISVLDKESIHIDILVNNVGITPPLKQFRETGADEWLKVFNTNVFGPCHLARNIIQKMVEHRIQGSIIFITSIHQETVLGSASYSSSKAALGMLIKELSMECAKDNIRVNGIAPGWVKEGVNQNPFCHRETPLLNSSINPRYIGRGAVYLASDYFSRFTTGTIIKIDAGLSLHSYMTRN